MRLPYEAHLIPLAGKLRQHSTLAEVLLWRELKGRQRRGYDFHRQRPIHRWIVDFFAPELMLAVEVDGVTHDFKASEDALRQSQMEGLGISFLRFGEREVRRDPSGLPVRSTSGSNRGNRDGTTKVCGVT